VAAAHGQEGQLLRVLHRQAPQQDLIQQGEYRGVGADAEGQGKDGHHGEGLGLGEAAKGESEVLDEVSHGP
jgi:hypothetical protein